MQTDLFSYKLTNDSGFAPNPFFGVTTLATCKPGMRQKRDIGDWIAGFTSGELCGDAVGQERLVFLMKVTGKLKQSTYFEQQRFASKIPDLTRKDFVYRAGDNIYRPITRRPRTSADFEQIKNPNHWDFDNDQEDERSKEHDLSGEYVLFSTEFHYFGRSAVAIPRSLRPSVPKGQSPYGCRTHDQVVAQRFVKYVTTRFPKGVLAAPHRWPSHDRSWRVQ